MTQPEKSNQVAPDKDNETQSKTKAQAVAIIKLKKIMRSAAFKSVALHSAILASLLVSFNFSAKPLTFITPQVSASKQPEIVNATFIDSNVIEQKKREKAQAEADVRKRQQAQKRKEAERQELLRKKRDEDARKKREAQQEKQAQLDKLEREAQKERAIEQQRIKDEQQRAEQEKRQQALDKELAEQLEEEQARMSQANQKRVMTEVQKYEALVYSKVQQYLRTDGGFIGESCLVNIQLASDGLVLKVNAVTGNPALCRIAEAAVLRAGTLPVSKDPEVMARFRKFELEVSPER